MGREKPLSKRVSEALKLAEAEELGKQIGDFKGQAKKPLEVSLKEHIGKFIDNLDVSDLVELTAWLGLAYLIKPIIDVSEELNLKMKVIKISTLQPPSTFFGWEGVFPLKALVSTWLNTLPPEQQERMSKSLEQTDWQSWLLALAISALIIKFGPSILQSMGGVTKIGSLLLQ